MPIKNVYYLSKSQYDTLLANGTVTLSDGVTTVTYNQNDMYCVEFKLYAHNIKMTLQDTGGHTYTCYATLINDDSAAITDISDIFDIVYNAGNLSVTGIDNALGDTVVAIEYDSIGDSFDVVTNVSSYALSEEYSTLDVDTPVPIMQ